MSTVLAVLNEKGGSGKTTLSTNLARGLQLSGKQILLIDSDPQGSARDWYASAGENNHLPPVIAMDRPALFKELPTITRGIEWVIIDGAPQIEDLAVAALKVANKVLIPVQPSPCDIWAAETLVQLIKTRQEITGGHPVAAFVISRQIGGTKIAGEARESLEGYQLPIFRSYTSQRVVYAKSAIHGSTVLDDEPDGPAAQEIRELINEVSLWK